MRRGQIVACSNRLAGLWAIALSLTLCATCASVHAEVKNDFEYFVQIKCSDAFADPSKMKEAKAWLYGFWEGRMRSDNQSKLPGNDVFPYMHNGDLFARTLAFCQSKPEAMIGDAAPILYDVHRSLLNGQ